MKRIAALFVLIALCLPAGAGAQKKAASAPAKQPAASAPVAQPAPDPAPATTVAASPAPAQAAAPRKKRVAIFDFDYATVRSGIAAMFGSDIDVGKGISDLLVKNLVTDGTYSVIERKALDKILAEQNFSNSDRANPTSAAKIGKLLGLDAIIVGSITQFGNETKNTKIGGAGGGFGGFGIGGFGKKDSKAIVQLDARLVDIDTAEILGVAEGKGESKRSSTSMLGGGGNWHGFGGGNVDFGTSDFQQTIIGEAVKAAVDQMTAGVIGSAGKLQARVIKVEGLVAAVDGGQIVLNLGVKSGIKVGDHLSVERVTKEIKDPATGAVIRRMTSKLGEIEVTDVDEISAVCNVVSGGGMKVGDMAKTVTQ
ncbi:MAG: curli production assembly protein CsgG [Acidobacteriia bacterium]|nr:curli production assembly protein CsgG [Terriglobia bacterium]